MARLCLLLAFFTVCSISPGLQASRCWQRPYCSCYNDERPSIYCYKVRNVSDVVGLFKRYSPIYRIRLQGSFASLPSRAFDGISVTVLTLTAPLGLDIPHDALLGVQNLQKVILNRTLFDRIPDVFSNQNYGTFQSVEGRLSGLYTQLQNMSSATEILLRGNRISSVSVEAFRGSPKVQNLDLSHNELAYLHPATFEPMAFLEDVNLRHNQLYTVDGCFRTLNPRSIDLYGNNLTDVDQVFHQGMWNLRYLDLGGNPDIHVAPSTFNASLKSLLGLRLSNNGIAQLQPSLLENLHNLHFLYLNGNNLSSIPDYFLQHTPFLTTLELSNNRLKTVAGLLDSRRVWYSALKLTLDGNELTTAALSKVRLFIYSADLSRNRISDIRVTDVLPLERAVYLNLSRNDIGFLEEGCFRNFLSLEHLDLSYNPLKSLNLTLQGLPKLYRLHVRSSSLETLSEEEFQGCGNIKYIDLQNNRLYSVQGIFRYMRNLAYLDLSHNYLSTLTAESLPEFHNTSIRVTTLWMANNSWACDCRLTWFSNWVRRKRSRLMDKPICSTPAHLQGLDMQTLNQTNFEVWVDNCPKGCDCACKAEADRVYTQVQCLRKGLREVPEILPPNARSVNLYGNMIESFDGRNFLQLHQLEHLNLENNKILKVRLVLPPKLSMLNLAHNSLRTIPLDDWHGNASITLSQNPWSCNCDTWNFRNWLVQHNDSVVDLQEVRCGRQESSALKNRLILSLTQKDLCSNMSSTVIIISVFSVMLLALWLILLCFRKSLVALLYSCGCTCLKRLQSDSDPYDAFLMYSEEDESLALGELAKRLEIRSRPMQLCILFRDIATPRTPQKVAAYLLQCTKVIVLLTRNFIENQECMQLLMSAMSFSMESSSQHLIFITYGDLPPVSDMDPVLRTVWRSCTRLRWGQCLFWQKLMIELPKKGIRQDYEDTEDEPLMM